MMGVYGIILEITLGLDLQRAACQTALFIEDLLLSIFRTMAVTLD